MTSVQIIAKTLLWGAAGITANGIEAYKRRTTMSRVEWEGTTQEEQDALEQRYQEILDRLWPIVRDEFRACLNGQGGT